MAPSTQKTHKKSSQYLHDPILKCHEMSSESLGSRFSSRSILILGRSWCFSCPRLVGWKKEMQPRTLCFLCLNPHFPSFSPNSPDISIFCGVPFGLLLASKPLAALPPHSQALASIPCGRKRAVGKWPCLGRPCAEMVVGHPTWFVATDLVSSVSFFAEKQGKWELHKIYYQA